MPHGAHILISRHCASFSFDYMESVYSGDEEHVIYKLNFIKLITIDSAIW